MSDYKAAGVDIDAGNETVRRIRMLLDSWDHLSVARQEKVIGRRKSDGSPLSGGAETTPVDLDKPPKS